MAKEKCIICGDETPYDFQTHIDYRLHYIEGAGQLCETCSNNMGKKSDNEYVKVPTNIVKTYSNDQELGQKVRELFYKSKIS